MRKFLFVLLLISSTLLAKDEVKELDDKELSKKFVAVVKDLEVEKRLEQSNEFQDCIKSTKFDRKDKDADRERKATEAEACFLQKLPKDKKKLEELSNSLGLQTYGLVQGKDQKSIREYLSNKLYKSLTGIDRNEEKTKEMLKFENRKLIDQKVFVELYTNHIAKSVMYEVSRFCFENLRKGPETPGESFADHWTTFFNGVSLEGMRPSLTDNGKGGFGSTELDASDTTNAYEGMFKGIAKDPKINTDKLGLFFQECAQEILPLCNKFKKRTDENDNTGAFACLSLVRLQEGRTALENTKAVKKQFDEDLTNGATVTLDKGLQAQFFRPDGENSYDNLATITSYDLLEGGKEKNTKNKKLQETCSETPEANECKDYMVIDDSKNKAKHAIELEMRLKKQVELARLKEMDKESLEKYLESNGYLDLLERVKNGENLDFEIEIGLLYDAKRIAIIEGIKDKLGKRQMSEDEYGQVTDKGQLMKENVKDVEQERARMAQVVLFNNIITSYLTATSNGKDLGRYGRTWKKEQKALEDEAKVEESLFSNFKQGFKDDGGSSENVGIADLSFLDSFLGAPSDDK